jgi:integrase
MAGPDWAMLYALAVSSGLRSAELRSLTPATFDLDADPPMVTVGAAHSKHRRDDVQPLSERLVTELRGYLDGRGRTVAVFSMPHPSGVSRMLKADLRGSPWRGGFGPCRAAGNAGSGERPVSSTTATTRAGCSTSTLCGTPL